jgi:hypothetical protein
MAGPASVQGIFGTVDTLRIDRAAYGDWRRAARAVDPLEQSSAADQPATVRYYFEQGTRQSAEQLAAKGVSEDGKRQGNISGLYRQIIPTASLAMQTDPLATSADNVGPPPELMAPEVVKLEIAYYDVQKVYQEWDTGKLQGLPSGIEIILTLHEPRDDETPSEPNTRSDETYSEDELVEYRRFVRLPYVSPPQPADALLPVPGSGNNQQGSQQGSGQQGQGSSNGNQGGGQQGGGNNGGQNGGQGGSNGR